MIDCGLYIISPSIIIATASSLMHAHFWLFRFQTQRYGENILCGEKEIECRRFSLVPVSDVDIRLGFKLLHDLLTRSRIMHRTPSVSACNN